MRILIFDDDIEFRQSVGDLIRGTFQNVLVENLDTVKPFYEDFEGFADDPPDFIVLDMMIPWTKDDPTGGMAPRDFNAYNSGHAVLKLLSDDERTCGIPILICTALSEDRARLGQKFPPHVEYLGKHFPPARLVSLIQSMALGRLEPTRKSIGKRIWENTTAKVGWFGVELDVKNTFARKAGS